MQKFSTMNLNKDIYFNLIESIKLCPIVVHVNIDYYCYYYYYHHHNYLVILSNATCFDRKRSSSDILLQNLKNQSKVFLFERSREY